MFIVKAKKGKGFPSTQSKHTLSPHHHCWQTHPVAIIIMIMIIMIINIM